MLLEENIWKYLHEHSKDFLNKTVKELTIKELDYIKTKDFYHNIP